MVVSGAGLAASLAYLLINVMVIFKVVPEADVMPSILGDVILPLARASIDLSAVTPLVLVMFFLAIFWSGARLLRGTLKAGQSQERAETQPFPENFETLWVQLGLIGTLWGFMLIGLKMHNLQSSKTEADSQAVMEILLNSFGTALLSSFAGVVLAYIFAPPTIRLWRWVIGMVTEESDISSSIQLLNMRLTAMARGVSTLNESLQKLSAVMESLGKSMPHDAFKKIEDELIRSRKATEDFRTVHEKEMQATRNSVEEFANELGNHLNQENDRTLRAVNSGFEKAQGTIQTVQTEIRANAAAQIEETHSSSESMRKSIQSQGESVSKNLDGARTDLTTRFGEMFTEITGIHSELKTRASDREILEIKTATEQIKTAIINLGNTRLASSGAGEASVVGRVPRLGSQALQRGVPEYEVEGRLSWLIRLFSKKARK